MCARSQRRINPTRQQRGAFRCSTTSPTSPADTTSVHERTGGWTDWSRGRLGACTTDNRFSEISSSRRRCSATRPRRPSRVRATHGWADRMFPARPAQRRRQIPNVHSRSWPRQRATLDPADPTVIQQEWLSLDVSPRSGNSLDGDSLPIWPDLAAGTEAPRTTAVRRYGGEARRV